MKCKIWSDAVRRALLREDPKTKAMVLDNLAKSLINKALEGDVPALKEIGDRIDGRAMQALELTGAGGGPLQIDLPPLDAIRATMRNKLTR